MVWGFQYNHGKLYGYLKYINRYAIIMVSPIITTRGKGSS